MNKDLWRRLISLTLCAQMLCAPVTHAFAAEPDGTETGETREEEVLATPVPTETQPTPAVETEPLATPEPSPADESTPPEPEPTPEAPEDPEPTPPVIHQKALLEFAAKSIEGPPYGDLQIGYGNRAKSENYSGVRKGVLIDYNKYFAVERQEVMDSTYGGASGGQFYYCYWDDRTSYAYFCFLPDELFLDGSPALGRVPDKKFDGWYLYNGDVALKNWEWTYVEGGEPFKTVEYQGDFDGLEYEFPDWVDEEVKQTFAKGRRWTGLITQRYPGPNQVGNTVNVVGKWSLSDVASARSMGGNGEPGQEDQPGVSLSAKGTPQTLYAKPEGSDGIAGVATKDLEKVPFDADKTEYYLRVGADVEALDLSFLAAEPYYDYNTAKDKTGRTPPVTVTLTQPGETAGTAQQAESKMAPQAGLYGADYEPMNTVNTPASSLWTVEHIPLLPSAGAGKYYNDITVQVTSPDGSRSKTYTFHVQRLAEPTMTLNLGNTPMGMLARDDTPTLDKEAASQYFTQQRTFDFARNQFPMDAAHNNEGFIYQGKYQLNAWRGTASDTADYDCDQTAIVAYQNMAFHDPGFSLTNSQGEPVTFGTSGGEGYKESVKRTILLRHAASLSPDLIGQAGGEDRYYNGGALYENMDDRYEVLEQADGSDLVDLSQLNVLPGIYWIEYYYTDPVNGTTYDYTGQGFAPGYESGAAAFRRPLIVLPIPGDVNMDGVVNLSDAEALEANMTLSSGDIQLFANKSPQTDPVLRMVLYRAMDVNGDGKVNQADVDALRTTFVNKLNRNMSGGPTSCTYFYLPLPGAEAQNRVALTEPEASETGRAALEVVFLGKENGKVSDAEKGVYANVSGPRVDAKPGSAQEAIELDDVFWVGVRLGASQSETLKQDVKEFRFTLNYDSRYLAPATVLTQDQLNGMEAAGNDAESRWRQTLVLKNVSSDARVRTVWSGAYRLQTGDAQQPSAVQQAATPVFQSDRGITLVELEAGSACRELVFSVEAVTDSQAVSLQGGGWLLMVPFQLIKHPYGETAPTLVEAAMGSREFALTGADYNAYFDARGGEAFGKSAKNLRSVLYFPQGVSLPVRLGENKTQAIPLYNQYRSDGKDGWGSVDNAVYGDRFLVTHYQDPDTGAKTRLPTNANEAEVNQLMPPGLKFTNTGGIEGTPEQAGTWEFVISGKYFRLTVDKAQLRYHAEFKDRYYGETDLFDRATETNGTEYTYRYYVADIKELDNERARNSGGTIVNDGRGEHLEALLGAVGPDAETKFQAPGFRAYYVDAKGNKTVVNQTTPQGEYPVESYGASIATNYTWVWVDQYESSTVGFTANLLRILPRPIYLSALSEDYDVGTIFDDDVRELQNREVSTADTSAGVELLLPHDNNLEGVYEKRSLTGSALVAGTSALTIRFDATFQQNEADLKEMHSGTGKNFALDSTKFTEPRPVLVDNISLVENAASENYDIVGQSDTPVYVKGNVTRREPSRIKIESLPKQDYVYGELMSNTAALVVRVYYGSGTNETNSGSVKYNKGIYDSMYINVCWVDSKPADGEPVDEEMLNSAFAFQDQQVMTVEEMDGRYLCVWAYSQKADGSKQIVAAFSEEPFRVKPRDLVLTAKPVERYYGEENPALRFTYSTGDLAPRDRTKDGKPLNLTGDGTELEAVLAPYGYTPPELVARAAPNLDAEILDAKSPYTGANQAVTITGASAKNYRILYARQSPTGGTEGPDETFGYTTFFIHRRPVVVESVTQDSMATVYADTRLTTIPKLSLTADQFTLCLPDHTIEETTYYPPGGTDGIASKLGVGYAGDVALVEGDVLSLECDLRLLTDTTYWSKDLTENYFDMDAAVDGKRSCDGEVRSLTLTGPAAENYQLVYKRNDDARIRGPYEREYREQTYTDGGEPEVFLLSGVGTLVLRPITEITMTALPRLDYIYGQQFMPQNRGEEGLPLRVKVTYETTYDAAYGSDPGNTTEEEFSYQITGKDETGKYLNSFGERGLEVCYVPKGGDADHLEILENGAYVTVGDHDGGRLVVRGQRPGMEGENGENLVCSQVASRPLNVAKKTLTLKVDPVHRYYGEENGNYGFTFDLQELAQPDRDALKEQSYQPSGAAAPLADRENAGSAAAESELLQFVDSTYTGPTFQTRAWSGSDVVRQGYDGYDLTLSGGSMENYAFAYQNAKVYVYRRPIWVKSVRSSAADPIYTIFADTVETKTFWTNVTTKKLEMYYLATAFMNIQDGAYKTGVGDRRSLPLSGGAVYGSDELTLTVSVEFVNFPDEGMDLSDLSGTSQEVRVTSAGFTPGNAKNDNYFLLDAKSLSLGATGGIELRRITAIELTGVPKLEYVYGDTLDLSDLEVKITYATIGEVEGTHGEVVPFTGTQQFNSYGLYLNYYNSPTLPTGEEARLAIMKGRTANGGDHLTIAPTHNDPNFSHDGKYLVVSAQRHKDHDPVEPQMVRTNLNGPNQGEALVVHPLALEYTLSAGDKTYDHETETVGSLTLLNAFDVDGAVDAYHEEGITDVVYVATGAEYEQVAAGSTYDKYTAFADHVTSQGYEFTTGTYQETPYKNGLTYQPGYDRSQHLSFQFEDPNVKYQGATDRHTWGALGTIPVNVTNIKLAGPDAANYTISQAVEEGAETPEGYQGAARPEATIHKADRPIPGSDVLPGLELDVHTNAVRVDYKRDPDEVADNKDTQGSNLHFEYALQSITENSGVYKLNHVAGLKGLERYQDELFFGGEAVAPGWPEGYVPDESKLPKDEELKEDAIIQGQVYGWAGDDAFFLHDPDAYPGGVDYPGYELYKTERVALDRDTTYWGLVRIAETHNYKASPPLSTVAGMDAGTIQAALDTELERRAAQTALDEADVVSRPAAEAALAVATTTASTAAQALWGEAETAVSDAAGPDGAAERRAAALLEIGETGKWPEEHLPAVTEAAPAVKTYRQRLDLLSTTEERGVGEGAATAGENYIIPILESVWFTDVLSYEKKDVLDAVVGNHDPSRYYGYYWDEPRSAELKFEKDAALDLTGPFEVECEVKDENGQSGKQMVEVNKDGIARLYVSKGGGGGGTLENTIRIVPEALTGFVGDDPVQLTVVFDPAYTTIKSVSWSSSDRAVAVVDRKGVVTFVGPGKCTITAVSSAGRRDSIEVTVLEPGSMEALFPNSVVDPHFAGELFALGRDLLFHPEQNVTRGELVVLLAKLYRANENRPLGEALDFPDVTSDAEYAEAARLLSSLGIVTGVEDGSFAADRVATRAELVTMLARMLGIAPDETRGEPHAFADAGPGQTWAWAYIDALADAGLLRGVGEGNFAPGRELTRAEAAAFLVRLLDESYLPVKEAKRIPVDVRRDHWGFFPILRAVNAVRPPQNSK